MREHVSILQPSSMTSPLSYFLGLKGFHSYFLVDYSLSLGLLFDTFLNIVGVSEMIG